MDKMWPDQKSCLSNGGVVRLKSCPNNGQDRQDHLYLAQWGIWFKYWQKKWEQAISTEGGGLSYVEIVSSEMTKNDVHKPLNWWL